jgi:hypothetical protein
VNMRARVDECCGECGKYSCAQNVPECLLPMGSYIQRDRVFDEHEGGSTSNPFRSRCKTECVTVHPNALRVGAPAKCVMLLGSVGCYCRLQTTRSVWVLLPSASCYREAWGVTADSKQRAPCGCSCQVCHVTGKRRVLLQTPNNALRVGAPAKLRHVTGKRRVLLQILR